MVRPETRYARSGDLSIAYQVVGDGPPDLVFLAGYFSHVEWTWEEPLCARFLARLAAFARLIHLDKRGTGLSDRAAGLATLEERLDDIRAAMDAAGSARAALFGVSEGAMLAAAFAATYPARVAALVLYGGYASEVRRPDYPWRPPAEELRRQLAAEARTIHERWGTPEEVGAILERMAPSLAQDAGFRRWYATMVRLAASRGRCWRCTA